MIRIPFTSIHAPWTVLFTGAVAIVLIAAAGAAEATRRLVMQPPSWLRRHRSRAERDSRKHLRIPLAYPENVAGSDEAAEDGDFPAWLAELEKAGIVAGEIVREESQ